MALQYRVEPSGQNISRRPILCSKTGLVYLAQPKTVLGNWKSVLPQITNKTHHDMRIPERDVTYVVLSVYLRLPVPLGIKWIIPKLT